MLILEFALKPYWDINIMILNCALKKSYIENFVSNGLNYLFHQMQMLRKSYD